MKKMMMAILCAAIVAAPAAMAGTSNGAFGFLDGEGDAMSLFGVRLGQKMDSVEACSQMHNCINLKAKSERYEYCKFTPSGEAADSRFNNYTVCLDRTNRQVVAIFASANAKSGSMDDIEKHMSDFFGYVFGKFGNCETRIAEEMWQSGLMEWVFFFPSSGVGFVASSHTQFGEAVCLYDVDAMVFARTGFVCFVPDKPSDAEPWWGRFGPVVDLCRKYRSGNNSTASLFARHLAVSEKLLKSNRIAAATNILANAKNVGCFDSVQVSSDLTYGSTAEAAYNLYGYNNTLSMDGRLYVFKSNEDAFDFGIAQLVNEPLPAAVLARKVQRLEGIPDICLKGKDMAFQRRSDGCTVAVLIRANAVLVCEVRGEAGDIGAGISTLMDFYGDSKNYKLPINGGTEQ